MLELELEELGSKKYHPILRKIVRGIEKESLRISKNGRLSQTPHPIALGSALTHTSITTDYSEALLELITSPSENIEECLKSLAEIHDFVYRSIGDEILWTTSMPCIVDGEKNIPIAQYGSSNVAQMKTIYRRGLGARYGRNMQAIAGIHYNFSMPQEFWKIQWRNTGSEGSLQDYISNRYMGLIRNFHRFSWLLIYLFGASPAVCSTFLNNLEKHSLQPFDTKERSYYLPFATALRMGSLGYSSEVQKSMRVSYDSLASYLASLRESIVTPHPTYKQYSSGKNGDYQQLNNCLLQIENEFYSSIRPKRLTNSGETPANALKRSGIEYIEVRCIDVNPFVPMGIDKNQMLFLDIFLLFCLISESPLIKSKEQKYLDSNFDIVVNNGREPNLTLETRSGSKPFRQLAGKLLEDIKPLASLMANVTNDNEYISCFNDQVEKIENVERTPSHRILAEMTNNNLTFFELALSYSQKWASSSLKNKPSKESFDRLTLESSQSIEVQRELELQDKTSFKQYLDNYYAQYSDL